MNEFHGLQYFYSMCFIAISKLINTARAVVGGGHCQQSSIYIIHTRLALPPWGVWVGGNVDLLLTYRSLRELHLLQRLIYGL
jgi:hypothetical protein